MNEKLYCPFCKAENEYVKKDRVFSNGTKHTEAVCVVCNKWIKFIQSVGSQEFRMPYGKYKGKTLWEIVEKDREYMEWMSENTDSKIVKRIKEVLSIYDDQMSPMS